MNTFDKISSAQFMMSLCSIPMLGAAWLVKVYFHPSGISDHNNMLLFLLVTITFSCQQIFYRNYTSYFDQDTHTKHWNRIRKKAHGIDFISSSIKANFITPSLLTYWWCQPSIFDFTVVPYSQMHSTNPVRKLNTKSARWLV